MVLKSISTSPDSLPAMSTTKCQHLKAEEDLWREHLGFSECDPLL